LPKSFELKQNYPNPFNPTTTISYTLPATSNVTLSVFDLNGKKVAQLESGRKSTGTHIINFDASALSSGTYFYRLKAGNNVQTKKMVLIK
jgi:hypothetical protein